MTYAPQSQDSKLEAEARAFVRRYAATYGLDPDKVWRDHHQKLLKHDLGWFLNQRKQEELLADDYRASRTPGRNSLPVIQWLGIETVPAPEPTYLSFADYLERTTYAKRMARCHAAAQKANRERLLSPPPSHHLSGEDVWNLIEAAYGRCAYCGSLALENRPSKPNGAPAAWAQVGRRIGSLEHRNWRAGGGDNDLTNLAWCCLWCNTWENERRPGTMDHGGFHPPPDDPAAIKAINRQDPSIGLKHRAPRRRQANENCRDDGDDQRSGLSHPTTSAIVIRLSAYVQKPFRQRYCA